ncbi:hypothetical protein BRPE64_DCDS05180 (plasmid) [Caballeronia insecticola]|uniref:Uncharacterized protein n=1 Tax=Caballeronia insecticola TaxID=758793 RepID=R4WS78_9BURK|nr:hypothetical protein BRPE64_DCDS05180 [Caballeronia insecticola]
MQRVVRTLCIISARFKASPHDETSTTARRIEKDVTSQSPIN